MKKGIIPITLVFLVIICSYFAINAKSSNKFEGEFINETSGKSFEEILQLAQKNKKKIVINVYADWCGWCKKMERETFPDGKVQEELNKNYYFYRLNGESSETIQYDGQKFTKAQFAKAFGIRGFPSTIFLNYDSRPITVVPGYIDAKTFANILKYIGEDLYTKMTFEQFLKEK